MTIVSSAPAPVLGSQTAKASPPRNVGRRLAVSVPATAIMFAVLGPLMGAVIVWTLLVLIPTLAAVQDVVLVFEIVTRGGPAAVEIAYASAVVPAAMTGAVVALLSPYSASREQFLLVVAPVGALTTYAFAAWFRPEEHAFGTPLFLAMVGAGTAILCTSVAHRWPLGRPVRESPRARRDRLSRERAARLRADREPLF